MKKALLILLAVFLAAAACSKQSEQNTYDRQTAFIESFVSARMKADPNATLTRNGGAYRLTLHDTLDRIYGQRDSLRAGGKVAIYYACYTLTGASLSAGNLVATNVRELAEQAGMYLTDTTRYKLDTLTLDQRLLEGLRTGLEGVQQYDEGFVLFTGKFGFANSSMGTIPARSALAYQYWIEKIDNE